MVKPNENYSKRFSTEPGHSELFNLPNVETKGNLTWLQGENLPFQVVRAYWIWGLWEGIARGGHAHINQREILVAASGSFEVRVDNGKEEKTYLLSSPSVPLLLGRMVWRDLSSFSPGAVCLVFSSGIFSERDYIRDKNDFYRQSNP